MPVLPRRGSSFTPRIKDIAVMRVQKGEPREKIAEEMGISQYMLHVWICARLPQPEDYNVAVNLLKKGASRQAVSRHFGGKMPLSNLQKMKFRKKK